MDILDRARELAKLIQEDEVYKKLISARTNSDNDEVLQNKIGKFNLLRLDIDNEIGKSDRDDERLKMLNSDLHKLYSEIMENENMKSFNDAKNDADMLLNKIYALLTAAFNGEDPDTFDLDSACSGNCSSCGGCH